MGRIVTITAQCDRCATTAPEQDMHMDLTVPAVLGIKSFVIDLCDSCLADLEQLFGEIAALGRKPEGERSAGKAPHGEHPCENCSFVAKTAPGLGTHRARAHGIVGTSADSRRKREQRARARVERGRQELQPST